MIKNILQASAYFGMTLILGVFFSGCLGPTQNGVNIPSKEAKLKNSQTKIYIDKNATYKYEYKFLEDVQGQFAKGAKVQPFTYKLAKNSLPIKYRDHVEGFRLFCYNGTNACFENIFQGNALAATWKWPKEKKTMQFNSTLKDHGLLVQKKYDSKEELLQDYMTVAYYLITSERFKERYGYTVLYLDGEAFKNNQMYLKSLLSHIDFTDILEKQLKTRGFQVVDDKSKSDKILIIENSFFIKANQVQYVKRNFSDIKIYSASSNNLVNEVNLDMAVANRMGATSRSSSIIGAAFLALSFLGNIKSNDDYINRWVVDILNTKNPQDYTQSVLYGGEPERINSKFHPYELETNAEAIINVLELGHTCKGGKVIKRASDLPDKSICILP